MKVATGWSIDPNGARAVEQAWEMLRSRLPATPALIFMNCSHKYEPDLLCAMLARLAPDTRVVGGTSCRGVLTEEGLHSGPDGHALGLLGIVDEGGGFGVAAESLDDDPRAAARRATVRALENADRPGEMPMGIWVVTPPGPEELVLQGIDDLFNAGVPVFGGSAADDTIEGHWMQFSTRAWHRSAVVVAVLFPSTPIVFSFHSGYEPTAHHGIVTRASGRTVYEIDHRPAARVYDQWSCGAVSDVLEGGGNVLAKTTFHPLGIVVGSAGSLPYYRLAHPERVSTNGSLSFFATISEGTEVLLMRGTVESLTRRAGRVAKTALETHHIERSQVAGALVTYCAGCMLAVRDHMGDVRAGLHEALGDVPFLGAFTFGEQGCFAGGENRHGNLMISVLALVS